MKKLHSALTLVFLVSACKLPFAPKDNNGGIDSTPITSISQSLYIASGTCYAGGVPVASPTNQILKYNLDTGARVQTVVDYRSITPGDSPVGIASRSNQTLLTLVENTNGRHIDEINRFNTGGSLFLLNTSLTATLRGISKTADDSYLIAKTTAVEKFTAFRTRVTNGASPFINAPTGACATMNTAITFAIELTSRKILIGHAGTAPNNKIALFSPNGYASAVDCLSSRTTPAPNTTSMPVAAVQVSNNTILVAYASNVPSSNFIIAYRIDTSNVTDLALATATTVLSNSSLMLGASAMAFDSQTNNLYVASSPANSEKIEKFAWDNTAQTLTRVGSTPFAQGPDLSCISAMYIGE